MNKIILTLAALAGISSANAQSNAMKNATFEAGYGYQVILSPGEPSNITNYNSFGNVHLGMRIDINELFGVRGIYNYQNFSVDETGVSVHKVIAEATYNLTPERFDRKNTFKALAHAGFGLGSISSKQLTGTDLIGVFQIGVMPEYKLSKKVAVFLDLTYSVNFSQDYNFNGETLNGKKISGQNLLPTLGISVKPF